MLHSYMTYGILPLATLLLAGDSQWLTTNFSVIGSVGWGRLWLLLWGGLIILYVHQYLGVLIPAMGGGRWPRLGRTFFVALFFCAITTPYLPHTMPVRAALHVLLALTATIFLFFIVLSLLLTAHRHNPRQARPFLLAMAVIGAVTALLLAAAGIVSTALEVFLTLSNGVLLRQMSVQQW